MSRTVTKIIKASLFTPSSNGRWGLPLCLEGEPGVGKSAIIEELARNCGLNVFTLTASDRDPTEFSGLPFPDREHGKVVRLVDDWLDAAFKWQHGVLFIDELSTVPGIVQAVLLRAIRDGVFAGRELPKGVRCIAAMNPSEIAAGGHRIAQPLANRFGWIDFPPPDPQSWSAFMMRSGPDNNAEKFEAQDEEDRVLAAWDTEYAKAVGLMTSAMQKLPHLLMSKPKNNDPAASKAWPSPRTNEYATRAFASAAVHGLNEAERDVFIRGFIGPEAALELVKYQVELDLPDPGDVLDGNIDFKHNKRRIDKTWAVVNSCTTLVVSDSCPNLQARTTKMWEILDNIADYAQDIVAQPCRTLLNARRAIKQPTAFKVLSKIAPTLDAAGINWQDQTK